MKKRSRFTVVTKLIGLVKPLTAYMALAVIMGIVGHLCASFRGCETFSVNNVLEGLLW